MLKARFNTQHSAFNIHRLVGLGRFELPTSRLSGVRSNQLSYRPIFASISRTNLARPRYCRRIDCQRAGSRSDSLETEQDRRSQTSVTAIPIDLGCRPSRSRFDPRRWLLLRKEVIQPQVLLQLPCYDFTPITDHTLGASLPCGLVWRLLVQPAFVM